MFGGLLIGVSVLFVCVCGVSSNRMKNPLGSGVGSFTSLERRDFMDVRSLYRDYSSQMFCIRRHPPTIDVTDTRVTMITDIFVCRKAGTVQRLARLMARSCRDDMGLAIPIHLDDFTPAALKQLYDTGTGPFSTLKNVSLSPHPLSLTARPLIPCVV